MEDDHDVDVASTCRPESIHAGACGADSYLAFQQVGLLSTISVVKGVLDPRDDLIARLQVHLLHALLLIDNTNDLLGALERSSSGF